MATINGFTFKNPVIFIGHEGECVQGNIYLGRTKIAFWTQDGDGGEDWFIMEPGFSEDKLRRAMEDSYPAVEEYNYELAVRPDLYDMIPTESFMCSLVELCELEKSYKRHMKAGYPVCVTVSDSENTRCVHLPEKALQMNVDNMRTAYKVLFDMAEEGLMHDPRRPLRYRAYRSLDDFDFGAPVRLRDLKEDKK